MQNSLKNIQNSYFKLGDIVINKINKIVLVIKDSKGNKFKGVILSPGAGCTGRGVSEKFTVDDFILLQSEFTLKNSEIWSHFGNHFCTDDECFCGKYKKGDLMINCDGGCMYPGT